MIPYEDSETMLADKQIYAANLKKRTNKFTFPDLAYSEYLQKSKTTPYSPSSFTDYKTVEEGNEAD